MGKIKTIEDVVEIIPVGRVSAEVFAMLKAGLEKASTPLDDFDLILAACALANDLVLVTTNVKHFERIAGLRLTNWAQESPWPPVIPYLSNPPSSLQRK